MKRAMFLMIALVLAACGGAADLDTPTESAPDATATLTEIAATGTEPASLDDTSTPAAGGDPQITPVGEPVTPGSEGSEFPIVAAVQDLAERLNIEPSDVDVISVEKVFWSDASLGCPQPGMMYAQVITEGCRILLEALAQFYPYHSDTRGTLILCRDGDPQLPIIPLNPGEIQDGQPWMPAGTVEPGEPAY